MSQRIASVLPIGRVASLPMYDADPTAVEAWWHGIALALAAEGVRDVPPALVWPTDLDAHWRDPRLLLSQTCGYPLVTTLRDEVQVVGAFRYTAPGCAGINYRSHLVARGDDADTLGAFRGRRAAVNSLDSHSGSNALRGVCGSLVTDGTSFTEDWVVTGSHRGSLDALRSCRADFAAIDCITWAGLQRHRPEALLGLRTIGSTPAAAGPPLVTAASTAADELSALRAALEAACRNPALAEVREALFIGGFELVDPIAWQPIDDLRRRVDGVA